MSDAAPSFIHRFLDGSDTTHHPLLLLHGTGGNEDDLVPIGEMIDPAAAILSPRGKVSEGGMPRFFRRLAEGVFDDVAGDGLAGRGDEFAFELLGEVFGEHRVFDVPQGVGGDAGAVRGWQEDAVDAGLFVVPEFVEVAGLAVGRREQQHGAVGDGEHGL